MIDTMMVMIITMRVIFKTMVVGMLVNDGQGLTWPWYVKWSKWGLHLVINISSLPTCALHSAGSVHSVPIQAVPFNLIILSLIDVCPFCNNYFGICCKGMVVINHNNDYYKKNIFQQLLQDVGLHLDKDLKMKTREKEITWELFKDWKLSEIEMIWAFLTKIEMT